MAQTNHAHGQDNHGEHETHGSLKAYVTGYILSIVLTIIPLIVVFNMSLSNTVTLIVILVAAILQFIVQLFFFMHLKEGRDAKWNMWALALGSIILLLVVIGSLWIMTYNAVVT